ncbi:hypothetical protein AnigIFM50267_002576 [Aspergillus niger]|nr:hypothetical protein AnigIFM50267_002576 [Aspergillus niger]
MGSKKKNRKASRTKPYQLPQRQDPIADDDNHESGDDVNSSHAFQNNQNNQDHQDEQGSQNSQEDLEMMDVEFTEGPDDQPPTATMRRRKKPGISEWVNKIREGFYAKYSDQIEAEFRRRDPQFSKIESLIRQANRAIRAENKKHNVGMELGTIPEGHYDLTWRQWQKLREPGRINGSMRQEWILFDRVQNLFHQFNKQNQLPLEWNFSREYAEEQFGPRPADMEEQLDSDADSAFSYSDPESESEAETEDGLNGLELLEIRTRKEYSTLSHGKVLYWWPVGTGSQIFVRYGSRQCPIYRIRAGSSQPWDKRTTEQVTWTTPGTATEEYEDITGFKKLVYMKSRRDVQDVLGVGWKVPEDDDHKRRAAVLELRPKKETYPHTRILIKWANGQVSLERRGFIRRITAGSSLYGDWTIYAKAREMERAYWGHDPEDYGNPEDYSDRATTDSDSDSATSVFSYDGPRTRQANVSRSRKRRGRARQPKIDSDFPNDDPAGSASNKLRYRDIEMQISLLTKQLKRLQAGRHHR